MGVKALNTFNTFLTQIITNFFSLTIFSFSNYSDIFLSFPNIFSLNSFHLWGSQTCSKFHHLLTQISIGNNMILSAVWC